MKKKRPSPPKRPPDVGEIARAIIEANEGRQKVKDTLEVLQHNMDILIERVEVLQRQVKGLVIK